MIDTTYDIHNPEYKIPVLRKNLNRNINLELDIKKFKALFKDEHK